MHRRLCEFAFCVSVVGASLLAAQAHATIIATDSAADSVYASWDPGDNGGTGWGGGWTFRNQSNTVLTTTNGQRGWFSGSSLGNNSGETDLPLPGDSDINTPSSGSGRAWGLYSNGTTLDQVYAIRPLGSNLLVGDTVSWYMDNGNIASGQVVGLRFLSDATNINSRVFEARFVGGDTFYTTVGTPNQTSTIGFTRQGLLLQYTLTGSDTYSLKITRLENNVSQTMTGTNVNANAIVALAFKNQYAGSGAASDGFLNTITHIRTIPEASAVWLCSLTLLYLLRPTRRRVA